LSRRIDLNAFCAGVYSFFLQEDVNLIIGNCLIYNKADTVYARLAQRMKKSIDPILERMTAQWNALLVDDKTGTLAVQIPDELFMYPAPIEEKEPVQTTPVQERKSRTPKKSTSKDRSPGSVDPNVTRVTRNMALEIEKENEKEERKKSGKGWHYVEVDSEEEEEEEEEEDRGTTLNENVVLPLFDDGIRTRLARKSNSEQSTPVTTRTIVGIPFTIEARVSSWALFFVLFV
jgi:hypothetical protein